MNTSGIILMIAGDIAILCLIAYWLWQDTQEMRAIWMRSRMRRMWHDLHKSVRQLSEHARDARSAMRGAA